MRTVETTASYQAQPDQVWAVIGNPARWGEWLAIHKSWKTPVSDRITEGETATAAANVMNMPVTIDWTFEKVDVPRSITMAGTTPVGVTLALDIHLRRVDGQATHVDLRVSINGGMIDGPMGAIFKGSIVGALDKSLKKAGALIS
ncbi:type II toxin-antitoxin system Rv0910 family toxin [Nocardia concava]|uniref:type II toxin-antitoxin system Rv0910 family toxin n=1 Tax=Nocardia concava TaxID=257281 RepID=UPI0002D9A1D0|nr:SRPBCC family protein [Nocardia concava]